MKNPDSPYRELGNVSEEQIRHWLKVPFEDRLRWLEEANEFIQQALDPKARKIMEMFRKGEI